MIKSKMFLRLKEEEEAELAAAVEEEAKVWGHSLADHETQHDTRLRLYNTLKKTYSRKKKRAFKNIFSPKKNVHSVCKMVCIFLPTYLNDAYFLWINIVRESDEVFPSIEITIRMVDETFGKQMFIIMSRLFFSNTVFIRREMKWILGEIAK